MDCGIPFCMTGCPVNNIIPDFNDLVYQQDWQRRDRDAAFDQQFPGIYRARLSGAVRRSLHAAASTTIRSASSRSSTRSSTRRGKKAGSRRSRPKPRPASASPSSAPARRGSPAAQQLARAGHDVVVFEKNDRIGGLLRYGIPDFKMEKCLIDRRLEQMQAEGVEFKTNHVVGGSAYRRRQRASDRARTVRGRRRIRRGRARRRRRSAARSAGAGTRARWRSFRHGFFAAAEPARRRRRRRATTSHGDRQARRHYRRRRYRFRLCRHLEPARRRLGHPVRAVAACRPDLENNPVWPYWPQRLRTSSSHEEGANRDWAVATKRLEGKNGKVEKLIAARVEWKDGKMQEDAGLGIRDEGRPGAARDGFRVAGAACSMRSASPRTPAAMRKQQPTAPAVTQTSAAKVFAAGDMRRGQSLVVWAIREGRQCARAVDEFLMGSSVLPR